MKIVVRKDFVGVVAKTQYAAMLDARQLAIRWNNGPLPAQRGFFEHLHRQLSKDTISVNSGDVEKTRAAGGNILQAALPIPIKCTAR